MRGIFSRRHPSFDRLLIVESGSRHITEELLPHFYEVQASRSIDLLTCYPGAPENFDQTRGAVYSVQNQAVARSRRQFLRKIAGAPYTVVAIICEGTPILERWKWLIALRTPAKLLIVNEHAGYFFLDYWHREIAKVLFSQRAGFRQRINFRLVAELVLVPFTILYLILYAAYVHARRFLRVH